MTDDEKDGFDLIFRGSQIDAALISQFLNDNEIETFINNQLMGTIAPWQVAAGGFQPGEVMVNNRDFEKAKKLMEEYFPSK